MVAGSLMYLVNSASTMASTVSQGSGAGSAAQPRSIIEPSDSGGSGSRPRAGSGFPAGTAVRFEPGVDKDVELVPLKGSRVVPGLRLPAPGSLDGE